jgi:hypothetical protein
MKTTSLIFSLILVATSSNAQEPWDNPNTMFDTKKNFTEVSTIKWVVVDNVQKACEAESRQRGYGGFGYGILACSFFKGDQCTIITGKKTNMHTLGHEVRHCFQADWHK